MRDSQLTTSQKLSEKTLRTRAAASSTREANKLVIRGVGRVGSREEIAELPVKFAAGVMPLRVKDFAEVQIGHAFRTGAATHAGQEAVLGVAMMLMGEKQSRGCGARC
jgi:Cu/Ag efflux pump CusA